MPASFGNQPRADLEFNGMNQASKALDSVHQMNPTNVDQSYNDNEGLLARDYFRGRQLPNMRKNYSDFRRNDSSDSYEIQQMDN